MCKQVKEKKTELTLVKKQGIVDFYKNINYFKNAQVSKVISFNPFITFNLCIEYILNILLNFLRPWTRSSVIVAGKVSYTYNRLIIVKAGDGMVMFMYHIRKGIVVFAFLHSSSSQLLISDTTDQLIQCVKRPTQEAHTEHLKLERTTLEKSLCFVTMLE